MRGDEFHFGSFPNVEVLIYSGEGERQDLSALVRTSFRSRHKDRCAIFADAGEIRELLNGLGTLAEWLNERENIHWTGIKTRGTRRRKRTQVADYFDWFVWYMRWQRFGAFHTILLLNPIKYMIEADRKGYVDGLLTRLLTKGTIHRIIIVESRENRQRLQRWLSEGEGASVQEDKDRFTRNELLQLLLALLCGTRLTATQLASQAERSFWFSVNRDPDLVTRELASKRWLYEKKGPFLRLSEDALRIIQCITEVPDSYEKVPPEMDQLFRVRRRQVAATLEYGWLKEQVEAVVHELGFFTVPMLSLAVNQRLLDLAKKGDFPNRLIGEMEYMNDDERRDALEPSFKLIRRIAEELVAKGTLVKTSWYLEVGRPASLYALPGRVPVNESGRCGQCAFYVSVRRRCKIWWLLNQRIGHFPNQWGSFAPQSRMSEFELYKMKNSGKISPHSSACWEFLDKKRDYHRKQVPDKCDICGETLPRQKLVACPNCGTRYISLAHGVRVYTAYEHEFRKRYRELSGRGAETDQAVVYSRFSGMGQRLMERQEFERHRTEREELQPPTIMLFPGDSFEIQDSNLVVSRAGGRRSIGLDGLTVVDYGRLGEEEVELFEGRGATVRRLRRYPEISAQLYHMQPELREALDRFRSQLARSFAIAMAHSAINATERIPSIANHTEDLVQRTITDQRWFLRNEESVSTQSGFLTNEAMIMKGYWVCYDAALDKAFAQFGPRKKSRFVREHVVDPGGRAKGYTAVDAAINYLHQRRLFRCGVTNADLGLGWATGEGILHRRSANSREVGLLLDLADPVKFADHEVLLQAFLDYRLNWRDFRLAKDRKGLSYYYPSATAVGVLEGLGEEADNLMVKRGQSPLSLVDAYRAATAELVNLLERGNVDSYHAFVFSSDAE